MDAAAAREAVLRLRRRLTLASSGIYVVLAAECALSVAFGETTWAIVWAVLFVLFFGMLLVGIGNDRKRDAVVLGARDEAILPFLRARLTVAAAGRTGRY